MKFCGLFGFKNGSIKKGLVFNFYIVRVLLNCLCLCLMLIFDVILNVLINFIVVLIKKWVKLFKLLLILFWNILFKKFVGFCRLFVMFIKLVCVGWGIIVM